nr:uncharacterized mitochondrial protein AtMg00810-like [Tanacetum cinerariifolium]
MLTEKDYPLTDAVMILMLSAKLQVNEDCEMARDLVMKIFMEANKPKSKKNHAGCHLDRKSKSGSVQFLGDKLVCWSSKKQNCVSISTADSEYVTVSSCCAQVLWMRAQLTDYGFFYDKYEDKHENIDWNAVAEQIQEKHLDNIKKYQNLKRKPVSIAQARKNMIIYLKNMAGYKMKHFREEPKKKRVVEETLLQESFKKLKAVEVSGFDSTQEIPTNDPKEMSEEDVQNMLEIVPVSEFKVEALQVKEDLDALWRLVREKYSSVVPNVDKEKSLWVELKRLFKPDTDDVLWKLQRYMHYPITWKLHSNCEVHQVSSTTRRHDMFMLTEKDHPLSNGVMTLMLSTKLQVEEDSEMARDLVMKIFMKANQPKSKSLDTSSKCSR